MSKCPEDHRNDLAESVTHTNPTFNDQGDDEPMLRIRCTNCESRFQCAPDMAGEQVECPQCGAHLRVPFESVDYDALKLKKTAQARDVTASVSPEATEVPAAIAVETANESQRENLAEALQALQKNTAVLARAARPITLLLVLIAGLLAVSLVVQIVWLIVYLVT